MNYRGTVCVAVTVDLARLELNFCARVQLNRVPTVAAVEAHARLVLARLAYRHARASQRGPEGARNRGQARLELYKAL